MEMSFMTLQTEERFLLLEKVVGHGSVGVMAHHAVFHHRIMLKGKWPLVPGMALEAQIIGALGGLEHSSTEIIRSMRIMAVGATHLPFLEGMVGGVHHLGVDILMTGGAQLHFRLDKKLLVPVVVHLVTLGATNFIFRMHRTRPVHVHVIVMTGGAHGGGCFRLHAILAEDKDLGGITFGINMNGAGAVTSLTTGFVPPGYLKVSNSHMDVMAFHLIRIMTAITGIRTHICGLGISLGRRDEVSSFLHVLTAAEQQPQACCSY